MNPLDIGVIGIVALSALFAFARGFVREALSIIAWVGAAAITLYGFNWVYAQIEPRVHDKLLSQVIAGFGLFVIAIIVLTILTGTLANMVRGTGLSPIDRTLGFIFGLARGAFLVCFAYLLLDFSGIQPSDRPVWIREAKSEPYLHQGAEALRGLLPEALKLKSATAAEELLRTVDPNAAQKAEADRAMRALTNPAPPAPPNTDSAPAPSYRQGDKRELDRLIGTQH
ncbi:MAG TPA: CvpA family protein [Stellaceae bacterium]|nr:CvpA family protein [Stellaceae bacterium]